jgi:Cft2 family RNA processing exonuclease
MMNRETISFKLAKHWFRLKNYGIAIVGYQDPGSPGYSLQNSELNKEFDFGGDKSIRKCKVESFRFTSHALLDDLVDYILNVRPVNLFVIHGEEKSCNNLASIVKKELKSINICVPETSIEYFI